MPVRYERDDARRRVVITAQGAFQTSDMLEAIERQRAEDTWSYGMLYDLRGMTGHPTLANLREMMGHAASRPAEQPRGPVAIVATDPILYDVACTYAALGRSRLRIQVCSDLNEADLWLADETRP